MNTQSRKVIE